MQAMSTACRPRLVRLARDLEEADGEAGGAAMLTAGLYKKMNCFKAVAGTSSLVMQKRLVGVEAAFEVHDARRRMRQDATSGWEVDTIDTST